MLMSCISRPRLGIGAVDLGEHERLVGQVELEEAILPVAGGAVARSR